MNTVSFTFLTCGVFYVQWEKEVQISLYSMTVWLHIYQRDIFFQVKTEEKVVLPSAEDIAAEKAGNWGAGIALFCVFCFVFFFSFFLRFWKLRCEWDSDEPCLGIFSFQNSWLWIWSDSFQHKFDACIPLNYSKNCRPLDLGKKISQNIVVKKNIKEYQSSICFIFQYVIKVVSYLVQWESA